MYGLGPWRDSKLATDACACQEHVDAHSGTSHDFLRRHERAAVKAATGGYQAMVDIAPRLLPRVADTRNLRVAWDYLRRHGGPAPGPNGLTYEDLEEFEVWELLQVLSKAIRDGTYRAGPDRQVSISKGNNRGQRILRLQDIQDRVVHRAVAQIIGPLLDPTFDDNSDGFRPHRNRCHALAKAMHYTQQADRRIWVVADVKNAFDRLRKTQKITKPLKSFKKTSASLLRNNARFSSLESLFLGHAPNAMSDGCNLCEAVNTGYFEVDSLRLGRKPDWYGKKRRPLRN